LITDLCTYSQRGVEHLPTICWVSWIPLQIKEKKSDF